jgi:hypothetical protein
MRGMNHQMNGGVGFDKEALKEELRLSCRIDSNSVHERKI